MLEQSQGQKIRAKFCWDCRQWKKNISEGLYAYLQLSALSYSKAVFQAVRPPSAADLFGASYASGSKALWMFDHSRESRASGDHLPNMDISCGEQVLTMLRKDCAAFSLTGGVTYSHLEWETDMKPGGRCNVISELEDQVQFTS